MQPRRADRLAAIDTQPEHALGQTLAGGRDFFELGIVAINQAALHFDAGLHEGLVDLVADVSFKLRQPLVVDPAALFGDLIDQYLLAQLQTPYEVAQLALRQTACDRRRRQRTSCSTRVVAGERHLSKLELG